MLSVIRNHREVKINYHFNVLSLSSQLWPHCTASQEPRKCVPGEYISQDNSHKSLFFFPPENQVDQSLDCMRQRQVLNPLSCTIKFCSISA